MKKQVEPIVLIVALVLLGLGAATLAYLYPTVSGITGIQPPSATGKNVPALKADDITGSLAAWANPVFWNDPTNHNRLFHSDKYLFFASVYPNGEYIRKVTPDLRLPSGVLWSWYESKGLDPTDPNIDREDPDNDGFSNITEYKNEPVGVRLNAKDLDGSKATDPNDNKSHPDFLGRLRLQKFETQPFHIFFNGYQQLNGVYLFQLHLSDVRSDMQPTLKKTGDPLGFSGYVIGSFNQKFEDIMDGPTKRPVHTDTSILDLTQPDTGNTVHVPFRKEINSPDVTADFVMLMPTEKDKVIRIAVGKTFSVPFIKDKSFLVIKADEHGAVIQDKADNKTYTILMLDEKNGTKFLYLQRQISPKLLSTLDSYQLFT